MTCSKSHIVQRKAGDKKKQAQKYAIKPIPWWLLRKEEILNTAIKYGTPSLVIDEESLNETLFSFLTLPDIAGIQLKINTRTPEFLKAKAKRLQIEMMDERDHAKELNGSDSLFIGIGMEDLVEATGIIAQVVTIKDHQNEYLATLDVPQELIEIMKDTNKTVNAFALKASAQSIHGSIRIQEEETSLSVVLQSSDYLEHGMLVFIEGSSQLIDIRKWLSENIYLLAARPVCTVCQSKLGPTAKANYAKPIK